MSRKRQLTRLLALVALLVGAFAGAQKELVVLEVAEFLRLDPAFGATTQERSVQHIMFNSLVRWDENLEIIPDLATSWSLSEDGLTWTFEVRDDATFWDGTPVRPEDIKYSIDRVLDPATNASRHSAYTYIESVEVAGPTTVIIRTYSPNPDLLEDLADGSVDVVPEEFVKRVGAEFGNTPDTIMGSGPYRLVEWVRGERAVFEPHIGYHLGKPNLDRIVFRFVPESFARIAALLTGEGHVANRIPPEEVDQLRTTSGIQLLEIPSAQLVSYELNTAKGPLADVRVRRALNMAIDREAIINAVLNGLGDPANSPTGPVSGRVEFDPYPYDPEEAMRLLAEAGYPNGFELTLNTSNGRYLKDQEAAEAIQAYLEGVGIRTTVEVQEWAVLTQLWGEDPFTHPKQAWLVGRSAPNLAFNLRRLYHTEATLSPTAQTWTGYDNPEVDRLLDEAQQTFDEAQRLALLQEAQRVIWEDAPFFYLWSVRLVVGIRDNVTGVVVTPRERLLLNNADIIQ
jgi:peptide/nickel transport system substrate-binding protein